MFPKALEWKNQVSPSYFIYNQSWLLQLIQLTKGSEGSVLKIHKLFGWMQGAPMSTLEIQQLADGLPISLQSAKMSKYQGGKAKNIRCAECQPLA